MKLKLIVASMSAMGLLVTPAFAATSHVKLKHHCPCAHETPKPCYKDMGALPVCCPPPDNTHLIIDRMTQNTGRMIRSTMDCNKMISFAGGLNFDAHWGNINQGYMGENNKRFSLNDAYLNINGKVTDIVDAFLSVSYSNPSGVLSGVPTLPAPLLAGGRAPAPGMYSNVYSRNRLNLEQGWLRISDFNTTPFFLQLGKQFVDFGRYTIHPIERPMTQVMTETLRTAAELGFIVPMGLHGSVSAFDDSLSKANGTVNNAAGVPTITSREGHPRTNYTAALGFDHICESLGFDVGAGYMYNFVGVNDIAYAVANQNSTIPGGIPASTVWGGSYINRIGAGTIYADINSGPFWAGIRYVTALQRFSVGDLPQNASNITGAKPSAGDIRVGYGFYAWNKSQNIYLRYEASSDAVALLIPQKRYVAGYNIDVVKNTNVGLEVGHDIAYSKNTGGTGNNTNTIGLRVGVVFG